MAACCTKVKTMQKSCGEECLNHDICKKDSAEKDEVKREVDMWRAKFDLERQQTKNLEK